jgi:hypothetical protein
MSLRRLCGIAAVVLVALSNGASIKQSVAQDEQPSGSVRIDQVQIAFIGSGNIGGGVLTFEGKQYSFSTGGLGIGGIGFSKMVALGEVYGLKKLEDFPGAYVQGRYGAVVEDKSVGELWLQNDKGVSIRLAAEREGYALSLGGDAVYIEFD